MTIRKKSAAIIFLASLVTFIAAARLVNRFAATPTALGVVDGNLAPCPDSPNCVCTQSTDPRNRLAPVALADAAAMRERIRTALSLMPRTHVVADTDGYFHAECRSWLCGFVDDVEIYLDTQQGQVHIRSASRIGYYDLGVNRRRVETLRSRLLNDSQ